MLCVSPMFATPIQPFILKGETCPISLSLSALFWDMIEMLSIFPSAKKHLQICRSLLCCCFCPPPLLSDKFWARAWNHFSDCLNGRPRRRRRRKGINTHCVEMPSALDSPSVRPMAAAGGRRWCSLPAPLSIHSELLFRVQSAVVVVTLWHHSSLLIN